MNSVVNEAGFAFVQGLAADLNTGSVKVPSFPDIVVRIRKTLDDENCNVDILTRLVSSEPALAARLLSIANSALIQRGGKTVADLRTAINRLGYETVHSAAMSVAVEQIFIGSAVGPARNLLKTVWKEAGNVAAISFALARHLKEFNPDEALLAGLLHNVGKLYIVMRAADFAEFFSDDEVFAAVIEHWHGQIGQAILEGWEFPEELAAVAANHMDLERAFIAAPSLTDLVSLAWMMTRPAENDSQWDAQLIRACRRVGLDEGQRDLIINESQAEIQSLASAFGG